MIEKTRKQIKTKYLTPKDRKEHPLIELQDQSLNLEKNVLKEAAHRLRLGLGSLPKNLFSEAIPPPYAKSYNSRPFHFTKDGLHLMYFTETEFIKLNLKTSEIIFRRELPRADLSPIYLDYKIWSQDDSKVLVLEERRIIPQTKEFQIYVYDVHTGRYTEIARDIFSYFKLDEFRNRGSGIYIECFNPLINHQVIIRQIRLDKENLYSWNYKIKSMRPFAKNIQPPGCCVIPISPYIVILNQKGNRTSWNKTNKVVIEYLTVYQAKEYKKMLTMKNSTFAHIFGLSDWGFSLSKNTAYYLYSRFTEKGRYKICLKYKNECYFILDLLRRNLNDDQMTHKKTQNTIAVYPSHDIKGNLIKSTKEKIGGFTFVRTKVNSPRHQNLIGNRIRIFEESNMIVKITLDQNFKENKVLLEVFHLRNQNDQVNEPKDKKRKKKGNKGKSAHKLLNRIEFEMRNYLKNPFNQFLRKNESKPYKNEIHILRNHLSNRHLSTSCLFVHKVIDHRSGKLKKIYLFGQEVDPSS